MKFAIGSNNLFQMGLVDTISNLIWLQCQNCQNCYKQDFPIFDPSKSTSFQNVPCSSDACGAIPNPYCTEDICQYQVKYASGGVSSGGVARDTFSLSPGALSLTSQLSNSLLNKFSYCLVPAYAATNDIVSILNFGDHALVSGPDTVSTPLKYGPNGDLYYLTLEGVSVGGGKMIELEADLKADATNDQGNIIIDLGTTLTFLPEGLYEALESELVSRINSERVYSPTSQLKLCYKSSPNSIEVPILTAHFTGANIVLNRDNTFLTVKDDVVCLAIAPSPSPSVYGNIAMRNFLVGIDRDKNVVSFMPTDCSKRQ
ncbi:unnamed protein product [Lupinus luteus]|uniref:Peptidase A1 domain-containing protein n=1 Tax=Lupinus luteus TaxID=3873 RepID=A0AAV1XN56_LUPLU